MCQYDPICTNFISVVNSNNISQMSCDTTEPLLVKTDFSPNNQGYRDNIGREIKNKNISK